MHLQQLCHCLALPSSGTTKHDKGILSQEHRGGATQAMLLAQPPTAEQLSKYHVVLMSYENFMVRWPLLGGAPPDRTFTAGCMQQHL
jgi:hypothetical protein